MVLLATGYTLDYPFVARDELNWTGWSPTLFLNVFPPSFNGLYVMGMIEASGIGWQGRYEQAELIAAYLSALDRAARARRRSSGAASPTSRGPTSPAATSTSGSSACRTTSTRTPTGAPCATATRRSTRRRASRTAARLPTALARGRPHEHRRRRPELQPGHARHPERRARADHVRHRAGHLARRLQGRRAQAEAVRHRDPGAADRAAGRHVLPDADPAGDAVDGARHDPRRVLPARQHLAGAHAPLRRQRRAVGVDDGRLERHLHLRAAAERRVLGLAAPDRPRPARRPSS